MKATFTGDVAGFAVPGSLSVRAPTPPNHAPVMWSLPLSALDPDTLSALCSDFRAEVFRQAGKNPPPTAQPPVISQRALIEVLAGVQSGAININEAVDRILDGR